MRKLQKQNEEILGKYKVKFKRDVKTGRKPSNKWFEDYYIQCKNSSEINYYGNVNNQEILEAYFPNKTNGMKIVRKIKRKNNKMIIDWFDTDEEVIFKFLLKDLDYVYQIINTM